MKIVCNVFKERKDSKLKDSWWTFRFVNSLVFEINVGLHVHGKTCCGIIYCEEDFSVR